MEDAIKGAIASDKRSAIITRRPCLLIKRIKHDIQLCVTDETKCIGCKKCLKVGCPALMIKDGKCKIDANQCVGCTVCAQVCPVGAISRKEK
jgi:indolepyruvate ferredoxin oxidoreductase alpha subunit